ncbi:TasA family protein [Amphibacillus sp. Q70]|uniref:TasA family protein n=1 Tax=Amphibacillus sp. Q70 TaxID=3453416 RepID=UPI003F837961
MKEKQNYIYKWKLILTGFALLVVTIGTTYAWYTASAASQQEISMGNIEVIADFPELTDIENYEPGTYVPIDGKVENTGSLPALVKLSSDSQIRFTYSDNDFTEIPEADRAYQKDKKGAIELEIKPSSGLYDDPDNQDVYWFEDTEGNRYMLLEPNSSVDLTNNANFDGDVMGNQYQQADVKISSALKATQVIEGAISNEFSIDSSDLIGLDDSKTTAKLANNKNRADQRLDQLLNRENNNE